MRVTFTRTAERRYRVSVEGPGIESSYMEPAAGYDPKLPHDVAHFIVENELGIKGGVFGQLAAGGHAGTFRSETEKKPRKAARRGNIMAAANRSDALFSEHAVHIACSKWNGEEAAYAPMRPIPFKDIDRICRAFDDFSSKWSKLGVGESITLEWKDSRKRQQRNLRR